MQTKKALPKMPAVNREGYDPEWIEYETSLTGPMLPENTDPHFKGAFEALMENNAKLMTPPPQGVVAVDEQVSEHVAVRIYQPPSSETGSKLRPVVVFYHGGGWVSGNLDTEDYFCRTLCGRAGVVVVSVLYRKFPDIRFPDNISDCFDGFQWAYENASKLRADTRKYTLMGGSAGGGLAVATTHKLIQSGHRDHIAGLLPLTSAHMHPSAVPPQYKHLHVAMQENSGPIPFVTDDMVLSVYQFLGGEPPYNDKSKHWFPTSMGVEGVKDFPPTWILDCEKDCMRDDGRVLQAEMEDAGLTVRREVVKGMPHYYWAFPLKTACEGFWERLIGGLEWVLETGEKSTVV